MSLRCRICCTGGPAPGRSASSALSTSTCCLRVTRAARPGRTFKADRAGFSAALTHVTPARPVSPRAYSPPARKPDSIRVFRTVGAVRTWYAGPDDANDRRPLLTVVWHRGRVRSSAAGTPGCSASDYAADRTAGAGVTRVWECASPRDAQTLMLIHGVTVTAELNRIPDTGRLSLHLRVCPERASGWYRLRPARFLREARTPCRSGSHRAARS
jgi:hypothetical protein